MCILLGVVQFVKQSRGAAVTSHTTISSMCNPNQTAMHVA